jgi:hypothetical protein
MKEAMTKQEIKIWRNKTMGALTYTYFVTSLEQRREFLHERKWGTEDGPNKAFHVYVDEDVDRNSKEYKFRFRLSREIDI